MVRSNQLINCSAKVHFRYQSIDSNAEEIQNCFEKFEVLERIYGNKDFGICYKFSFKSKGVYLRLSFRALGEELIAGHKGCGSQHIFIIEL